MSFLNNLLTNYIDLIKHIEQKNFLEKWFQVDLFSNQFSYLIFNDVKKYS